MNDLLQYSAFGLATGGFLLLASIGFALVRTVEGYLNIAHAQYISFGAYTTWTLNVRWELSIVVSAVLAVAATALLALLIDELVYKPIHSYGDTILLITSVGVAFSLQGLIQVAVPVGTSLLDIGSAEAFRIASIRMNPYQALVLAIAIVVVIGLHLLVGNTRMGRQIQAVSVDRELAQSRGVSVARTSRIVCLISGATAGMAGVALGLVGTLTTDLAFQQILLVFAVTILAGHGSMLSLLVAALVTGLAMNISLIWVPSSVGSAIPFAIIIGVLLLRPQGLATVGRA